MQDRYYSETYRGKHIALLWVSGAYNVFIDKEYIPGWRMTDINTAMKIWRSWVDDKLR